MGIGKKTQRESIYIIVKVEENTKKVWLYDVSILRLLGIVLVVWAHCFAIYSGAWPTPQDFVNISEYSYVTRIVQPFRIPLIVFVAGYVLYFQMNKRIPNFSSFVRNKFMRLIIPSVFFSIIYAYFFRDTPTNIIGILEGVGHMWYLPMLFWCFIMGYTVCLFKLVNLWCLPIFMIISMGSSFLPFNYGIEPAMRLFVYFYFGMILIKNRELVNHYINLKNCVVLGSFSILSILILIFSQDFFGRFNDDLRGSIKFMFKIFELLINILTITFTYFTINYLLNLKILDPSCSFFKWTKYSYGIYIYHQFILMILIYNFNIYKYIDSSILPLVLFIISLFISVILSKLSLKTRLGRFLIS